MDSEVRIADPYIDGVVSLLGKRVSEVDCGDPVEGDGCLVGRWDELTSLLGVGEKLGVVEETKSEDRKDGEEDDNIDGEDERWEAGDEDEDENEAVVD